jgi:hypothetical protein
LQAVLEQKQVDAWLVYNGSKDPEAYAGMWIDAEVKKDSGAFLRTKDTWVEWYRRHKIEQIALGAVTLQRRASERNWFYATEVNTVLENSASEQIQRLFAGRTALASLWCLEDLFALPLAPTEVELVPAADGQATGVHCLSGLRLQTEIRPLSTRVLGRLNGKVSLQVALDQASHELGFLPDGASAEILEDFWRLANMGMVCMA